VDQSNEQQQTDLRRYGFDVALQQRWQKDVAAGRLSEATNAVSGELLAPPPGAVRQQPNRSSKAHRELEQLGLEAIQSGQLGVVLLNGGVETSFGGRLKGLVPVLSPARTFLSLAAEDVLRHQRAAPGEITLFCMNSFATDAATRAHFEEHDQFGLAPASVEHFSQSVAARMTKKGKLLKLENGEKSLYGPGHGDFAAAFRQSGALQRFLDRGGRYLLVRNIDNLGARVDPVVLGHHIQSECEVTVEVAPRWPEDVGGSPYQYLGRTQLIEQLRYPKGFAQDIADVVNTNTFTFSAASLDRDFDLGWYYVEKEVEGRTAIQVEHLIGEMTAHLQTGFLQIRRSGRRNRFLPVKTPEDLQVAVEEIAEMYDDGDDHDA